MGEAGPGSVIVAVVAAVLGVPVGTLIARAVGRYPWRAQARTREVLGPGRGAVGRPFLEVAAALLFGLTALRFGISWELPAFLLLATAGLLLAVIDLRHRVLPNRVVLPALGGSAALLVVPAAVEGAWVSLLRAGAGAVVLFTVFLVLALVSPGALGMGDVKLAAVLGLCLGWLSWGAVLAGALAGFVLQAAVTLGLLATRRIGLRGELPFGPAMLAGAAVAIGWSALLS
ncbi:prepilin peptidase [Geodermatophilus sp. SYSU D01105]